MKNREILDTFALESLPDLDIVTLGALELFTEVDLPDVNLHQFKRPLVVGSGNAAVTGKLLFDDTDAVFADESSYVQKLNTIPSIDGAFLISASGGKHAVGIVQELARRSIPVVLLTNNEQAPARDFLDASNTFVFPKNREPYTYNTSTYLGMILSKTCENPSEIHTFIMNFVAPIIDRDFTRYDAFYVIVPEVCTDVRELFQTKFDELFGPKIKARFFTLEQTKHAKTVIPHETELFISFGVENTQFGEKENRLYIPLPDGGSYASLMAVGYYVIGNIQKQFPPYYKQRIEAYAGETSAAFGSTINPIVE